MPAAANLVHQSTTGTGAGNLTLAAINGKRTFDAAFGHAATPNVFDYFISSQAAAEWERGTGHMSDAATLVRDTVIESSNANAAVSFSAGIKDVSNDIPAGKQLQADATATISKGFTITPASLGNIASFTIDPTLGNYQYGTNHAAATWTAPAADCAVDILVTNDATAGAITFSGFTVGANVGDALDTVNGHKFIVSIRRINAVATYVVKALQ